MPQASIWGFTQAQPMIPTITKPKLQLSTISPSGSVVTIEDLILMDKDKPNRTGE
jgi:hypothetical protein